MAYEQNTGNEVPEASGSSSRKRTQEISQPTGQSFHLFPGLPPELQDLVWEFSLPRRRLLNLSGDPNLPMKGLPPPTITHVCSAARATAIRNASVLELPYTGLHHRKEEEGEEEESLNTQQTTIRPTRIWFDGARDVLHIDLKYPYRDLPAGHYSPLYSAAETIAVTEERLFGWEPQHQGFLLDVVRGERFPRLRRVLVLSGHVIVMPQSLGLNDRRYVFYRAPRTAEAFSTEVLSLAEARILKLLRIAHARLGLASRLTPRKKEEEEDEDEACGGDEVVMLPVRHGDAVVAAAGNGDGDGDGLSGIRIEPLVRDHPWVQKRWSRLPEFIQAISVTDFDTGAATCEPYSRDDSADDITDFTQVMRL